MAGWLKQGDRAARERQAEDKRREEHENRVYRFWMPKGKEQRITFLDGVLTKDGMMGQPVFYEHNLFLNGTWKNWFICTRDEEPCPLCMAGNKPAMVSPFTIVDHAEWTSKRDGKVHRNEIRLFIAKAATLKKLERKADKLGGSLVGVTFEVFRSEDDKAPSVGDEFEYVDRNELPGVREKYGAHCAPVNYEDAIPYLTAAEMRNLGLGSRPVGAEEPTHDTGHAAPRAKKDEVFEEDIPF